MSRETTEISIRAFALIPSLALVAVGVITGASRFDVTSNSGVTGTCASVFNGPPGDLGNAYDAAQKRALDELTGPRDIGPTFDALCDSKRASRGTWTWGLVGFGVVLASGAVLIRPTRNEM
jgi:hypothetical protein